jgi:hypothetical protein
LVIDTAQSNVRPGVIPVDVQGLVEGLLCILKPAFVVPAQEERFPTLEVVMNLRTLAVVPVSHLSLRLLEDVESLLVLAGQVIDQTLGKPGQQVRP